MTKKLMVAGCSFSAVSRELPGTAWSELLAKKLGWELVNLARQGCSNGGIRIQIDEIRRQRPDFAVVSATFWDRMEIPAGAAPYDWNIKRGHWAPPLQTHLQDRTIKNGYDRKDGINNVNYGNNNYNMICETIFSLAENYEHPYRSNKIDKNTQKGIRAWIDSIYDSEWKKQQDEWIISQGLVQMYCDDIKFLFLPNLLWPFDPDNHRACRADIPKIVPDEYLQLDYNRVPSAACHAHPCDSKNDPGYHGDLTSQELIAEWYYDHITKMVDL
jgi:hypothetical protein